MYHCPTLSGLDSQTKRGSEPDSRNQEGVEGMFGRDDREATGSEGQGGHREEIEQRDPEQPPPPHSPSSTSTSIKYPYPLTLSPTHTPTQTLQPLQ